MLQFSPSELLGGSVCDGGPRFAVYPDSGSSAVAFVAARELYGMKFMQSNIKLGRDLSNLQIGSAEPRLIRRRALRVWIDGSDHER
jgi:hypothetical protein